MDIKNRLLALPDEIVSVKKELLAYQEELAGNIEAIKKWELEQMNDIANALDASGKPLYSNDVKRQAELQVRKDTSESFKAYKHAVDLLTYRIKVTEIMLSRLYDEQGNLRAICRLEEVA